MWIYLTHAIINFFRILPWVKITGTTLCVNIVESNEGLRNKMESCCFGLCVREKTLRSKESIIEELKKKSKALKIQLMAVSDQILEHEQILKIPSEELEKRKQSILKKKKAIDSLIVQIETAHENKSFIGDLEKDALQLIKDAKSESNTESKSLLENHESL
jgi:hypothetical protein